MMFLFKLKTLAFISNGSPVYTRGCLQTCPNSGAINNNVYSGIFCCSADYCNNIVSVISSTTTVNPISLTTSLNAIPLTTTVNYNLLENQGFSSHNFLNRLFVLILNLFAIKTAF